MMAISDSGLISVIMINTFSSMRFGINTLYIPLLERNSPYQDMKQRKEKKTLSVYCTQGIAVDT